MLCVPISNKTALERFEDKFTPEPNTGCWLWLGYLDRGGYGVFKYNNKPVLAHRVSYILYKGGIADGLYVLHDCDNPLCVNPNHLYLGTHDDNMRDKAKRGRVGGELHPRSKLSNYQRKEIIEKYVPRKYSLRRLAKEYGVDDSTICQIIKNPKWNLV
jgi:hypothetical protein